MLSADVWGSRSKRVLFLQDLSETKAAMIDVKDGCGRSVMHRQWRSCSWPCGWQDLGYEARRDDVAKSEQDCVRGRPQPESGSPAASSTDEASCVLSQGYIDGP